MGGLRREPRGRLRRSPTRRSPRPAFPLRPRGGAAPRRSRAAGGVRRAAPPAARGGRPAAGRVRGAAGRRERWALPMGRAPTRGAPGAGESGRGRAGRREEPRRRRRVSTRGAAASPRAGRWPGLRAGTGGLTTGARGWQRAAPAGWRGRGARLAARAGTVGGGGAAGRGCVRGEGAPPAAGLVTAARAPPLALARAASFPSCSSGRKSRPGPKACPARDLSFPDCEMGAGRLTCRLLMKMAEGLVCGRRGCCHL